MIKLPIRVDESGDLTEYWSVAEVEAKLEPIDVLNGEYVVTDADGRPLHLDVVRERRPWFFGLFSVDVEVTKLSPPQ
ncbi:hypothetical protein ACFJGX_04695 [Hydrogenophaga sp. UC242_50]|uniref:hypothetical protein n=1 Tax=unclassified Hydrogenophaga TaxID=2610897 RepID=UPI0036D317AD